MTYRASDTRYDSMQFRRTGRSGLKLPAIFAGQACSENFGGTRDYPSAFEILSYAFDHGITHFDLANNYGPPPGAAEELFGDIMARDFRPYRDELIISSKAGWEMWPGPLRQFRRPRKYILASAEQSFLKRMGLEYVSISSTPHRFDPNTAARRNHGRAGASPPQPARRSMSAISNRLSRGADPRAAYAILKDMGVPLLIHQPSYSILNRWIEDDNTIEACGELLALGVILFSPLAQGILSGQYLARVSPARGPREKNSSINRRSLSAEVAGRRSMRSARSPRRASNRCRSWRWLGCCAGRK